MLVQAAICALLAVGADRKKKEMAPERGLLGAISQLAFRASCPGPTRTGCLLRSQMVASDRAQK